MKLSEAIRLGATLRPKCKDEFFKVVDDWTGEIGSCALGAAHEATFGFDRYESSAYSLQKVYPILLEEAEYPCTCNVAASLPVFKIPLVITHLNDVHGMSREEIADWVELEEERFVPVEQPSDRMERILKAK